MADPPNNALARPEALRPIYNALAPSPDAVYGSLMPVARNREGSAAWVTEGANPRLALPEAIRNGLLGWTDLLAGTETGEVTPRGIESLIFGGLGAGGALAPRNALASGGATFGRLAPDLAMDEASRLQRAIDLGFHPRLHVYHGTNQTFPAFSTDPRLLGKSTGQSTVGIWAAETPELANRFVGAGTGGQVLPLRARLGKLAQIKLDGNEAHDNVMGTIRDAFDGGYNTVRVLNYTAHPDLGPQAIWVFRDPNQLRSRFARFDPARRDSDDLLAARGAPLPVAGAADDRPRSQREALARMLAEREY